MFILTFVNIDFYLLRERERERERIPLRSIYIKKYRLQLIRGRMVINKKFNHYLR